MTFKKLGMISALTTSMLITACGTAEPASVEEPIPFIETNYTAVIEMIDGITVADLTTERIVEDAYIAYCNLDDSVKDKVTNLDKLQEYRNAITKLYHTETKRGDRINRSKLLISTTISDKTYGTMKMLKN